MNKTDIANGALRALGVSWRISDFDNDNANHAKVIRDAFRNSLETVNESSEWSFASKSRDLPYVGTAHSGWSFEYSLPGDCLVLRQLGSNGCFAEANIPKQFLPAWQFNDSADRIFCDVDKAWGKYTRRLLQDEEFPNYFGRSVSAQLAYDIAPALILDRFAAIKNSLLKAIEDDMERAIAYDSGRQPDNRQQVSSYSLLLR